MGGTVGFKKVVGRNQTTLPNSLSPSKKRVLFRFRPPIEAFLNPDKINGSYFLTGSPAIDACATWLWLCKRGPENEANMTCRARMPILSTVRSQQHQSCEEVHVRTPAPAIILLMFCIDIAVMKQGIRFSTCLIIVMARHVNQSCRYRRRFKCKVRKIYNMNSCFSDYVGVVEMICRTG